MKRNRLAQAGMALMAVGTVQLAGAGYFCWRGGIEGMLSPVAAVAAVWPVAALLLFLGDRMRKAEVQSSSSSTASGASSVSA